MGKQVLLRQTLRDKQRGRCCYCQVEMTTHKAPKNGPHPGTAETIEHLQRRADGGTNRRDNLALACRDCNMGRGTIDWLTYTSLKRGELIAALSA